MLPRTLTCPRSLLLSASLIALLLASPLAGQQRPMTFMDVQLTRSAGSWAPSPDGSWMLYTVRTPDWDEAESQTDIHVVSLRDGVASSRQLTFTDDWNETDPTWSQDGGWFVFASDRDSESGDDQLFMMRHDGGEARQITDAPDGVDGFDFSPDGRWLVYRSGPDGREQLHRVAVTDLPGGTRQQITHGEAGVEEWDWSPDGGTLYFLRPDAFDEADMRRREAGFTVDVKNPETPLSSLWSVGMGHLRETAMASDDSFSVEAFVVSEDGNWISFSGGSPERYERNITGSRLYTDQFLLEVRTG